MLNQQEIKLGFEYFVTGWHLIQQKGLRRFAVMPVLLNVLLLGGLFVAFVFQIKDVVSNLMDYVPSWLSWLGSILPILIIGMILVLYYFIFATLSGFIAAPFNGLLAEKVEKIMTGEEVSNDSLWDFVKDTPRMLAREWQKLVYSLPKIIALFLLSFIPLIGQTVIPVVTFLFSAWMMAIQYCDYPFDNHKIPFGLMKNELAMKRNMTVTFGGLVSLCMLVPIVNLVVIPVAACGATAMWVKEYRHLFKFAQAPQSGAGANMPLEKPSKSSGQIVSK